MKIHKPGRIKSGLSNSVCAPGLSYCTILHARCVRPTLVYFLNHPLPSPPPPSSISFDVHSLRITSQFYGLFSLDPAIISNVNHTSSLNFVLQRLFFVNFMRNLENCFPDRKMFKIECKNSFITFFSPMNFLKNNYYF